MEMPELNEDIMEAEGDASAELASDSAPVVEGEESQEMESDQPMEEPVAEVEKQPEEEHLEALAEEKPEEEVSQEGETTAEDESVNELKEDIEEPSSKRQKFDEDSVSAEEPTPEAPIEPVPVVADTAKAEITEDKSNTTAEGSQPDTDMLSTLASAALNQDDKEEKPETPAAVVKEPASTKKKELWHNVGVFDTNTTIVTDYILAPETNDESVDLATMVLAGKRMQLEPGTAYKLRVCAINACGAGPWSEVAAFKTTLPGFPGAPSAIKISKSADGAHLTWEPPGGNSGEILEYAVYLAVRSASQGSQPVSTNQSQLAFVRVFCGPTNKCVVGPNSLQAAHIDTTTKPAIIFRIAARNAKGYGPATQVRWLQESANAATPVTPATVKRTGKV